MQIGVPREIKNHEYRVGLTPESVAEVVARGMKCWSKRLPAKVSAPRTPVM